MRVDWAVACRYAEVGAEGTATIVGAGVDAFSVEELPARLQLVTALRLMAPEADLGHQHVLSIRLLGPSLNEIDDLTAAFDAWPPSPLRPPGWEHSTVVAMVQRFVADATGAYSFEISLNERHAKTVAVLVREGAPG